MTIDGPYGDLTRRSVLKTGAATAGAVTLGAAGAAAQEGSDEKRGGRAQVEGDPQRNEPFTLSDTPSEATLSASCMAEESAPQAYLEYDIEYCNDENDDTMYVIPDEAELAQEETYVFRATRECKATDNTLVAIGPSNQEC